MSRLQQVTTSSASHQLLPPNLKRLLLSSNAPVSLAIFGVAQSHGLPEHVLGRHDDGGQVLVQRDLGHLEDGDGVVADHIGATEGLREEQEDEEDHGPDYGPLVKLGGRLSPGPGGV